MKTDPTSGNRITTVQNNVALAALLPPPAGNSIPREREGLLFQSETGSANIHFLGRSSPPPIAGLKAETLSSSTPFSSDFSLAKPDSGTASGRRFKRNYEEVDQGGESTRTDRSSYIKPKAETPKVKPEAAEIDQEMIQSVDGESKGSGARIHFGSLEMAGQDILDKAGEFTARASVPNKAEFNPWSALTNSGEDPVVPKVLVPKFGDAQILEKATEQLASFRSNRHAILQHLPYYGFESEGPLTENFRLLELYATAELNGDLIISESAAILAVRPYLQKFRGPESQYFGPLRCLILAGKAHLTPDVIKAVRLTISKAPPGTLNAQERSQLLKLLDQCAEAGRNERDSSHGHLSSPLISCSFNLSHQAPDSRHPSQQITPEVQLQKDRERILMLSPQAEFECARLYLSVNLTPGMIKAESASIIAAPSVPRELAKSSSNQYAENLLYLYLAGKEHFTPELIREQFAAILAAPIEKIGADDKMDVIQYLLVWGRHHLDEQLVTELRKDLLRLSSSTSVPLLPWNVLAELYKNRSVSRKFLLDESAAVLSDCQSWVEFPGWALECLFRSGAEFLDEAMLDQLSKWIMGHPSTPFRDGPSSKANTLQCLYQVGAPGLTPALMKLHSAAHLALLDSASRNYGYGAESCRAMYSIFLEGRRHLDATFLTQECAALWEIQEKRDLWLIEEPLAVLYSAAGDKMTSAFVRQERGRILEHLEPQVAGPLLEILYQQGEALTRDEFLAEFDTLCAHSIDALWSTEMLKALLRSKDRVMLREEDVARLEDGIRALPEDEYDESLKKELFGYVSSTSSVQKLR